MYCVLANVPERMSGQTYMNEKMFNTCSADYTNQHKNTRTFPYCSLDLCTGLMNHAANTFTPRIPHTQSYSQTAESAAHKAESLTV